MHHSKLCYRDQVERVAGLIDDIERAFEARDFGRLIQLGNRLATDSVIAGALAKSELEERPNGPAKAA